MPGRWYAELFDVAADQNGFITTDDVRDLGATPRVLIDMHRHGHVDRVGHGLYRFRAFPAGPLDELMQATLWPRRLGVISHDTALDLWDLCDVNPTKIHVTVPKTARLRRTAPPLYEVHVRDLDPADVTRVEGIRVVVPARAILDGIERHLDRRLIDQAVEAARRRGLVTRDELAVLEAGRLMADFPVKGKPPHNVSVLERWLTEASKQTGVAAGRLRRWLGFMVVAAMLDEARHADDGEPLFLIKGGVAMELRVDTGARATKDLDTAFRASMEAVADHLDPALRAGHGDFTATRTELEPVKDTGSVRCDIKLAYRGKSIITVKMEVAAVEGGMGDEIDHVPAKPLDHVGLTGPETVPCIAVRWQIAQKLHACTEAFGDGENDRFRDLIDLQLIEDLVADDEWPDVKEACLEVFGGRGKHAWPPAVKVYDSWIAGYRALAEEIGFSVVDVHEAATAVAGLIQRIERA